MPQPRRQAPSHRPARWPWGTLPARSGVLLVIGGVAVGGAATVLTHREPGTVLGIFLVTATAAAALAVRPQAVRLIIPVPALAYLGAALIAGLVHDRATGASHTALAISAFQWAASGFLAMTAATVLAAAITVARWPRIPRRARRPERPPPAERLASPADGRNPSPPVR